MSFQDFKNDFVKKNVWTNMAHYGLTGHQSLLPPVIFKQKFAFTAFIGISKLSLYHCSGDLYEENSLAVCLFIF